MPDMTPEGSWQIQTLSLQSANKCIHGPSARLTFVEAVAVHVSIIREADAAVDKAVHRAEQKRGVRSGWKRRMPSCQRTAQQASIEEHTQARAYDLTHPRARPRREIRRAANRASTPAPRACVVRTAGSGAGSGRTAGRLDSRFAGAALLPVCGAVVVASGRLFAGAPRADFAGVPAAGVVDAFATTAWDATLLLRRRVRLLPRRLSVAAKAVRRLPHAGSWRLFMVSFHAPWSSAADATGFLLNALLRRASVWMTWRCRCNSWTVCSRFASRFARVHSPFAQRSYTMAAPMQVRRRRMPARNRPHPCLHARAHHRRFLPFRMCTCRAA
jgi:hypothetical protein